VIVGISLSACVWRVCPNDPTVRNGMYILYYAPGRAGLTYQKAA
jgi:hypothetical protein